MKFQPRHLVLKTKSQISQWYEDFESVRQSILNSTDHNKKNYDFKGLNLKEQEEFTVLYLEREIVAFSSLYCRDYYPNNISRVLNRIWKSPKIRYVHQSYWPLSRKMLLPQIKKAHLLNKSAVFISIEGQKKRWLKRFIFEAKKEDSRWLVLPGFYKVAPGDDKSCWQNVILLPLKKNYKFQFPHISENEWQRRFGV
ncbi:MAG: hypothetical protein GDA46_04315 [Bdellovibrionales bacterium]|nr:hypothetical protein [Bdellovibrionales bacterium]